MSNTVITNYTDLNGPSTKADSSVVVIVNKDGSLSVDQKLLGTLMGTDGSQSAGISVVRVGHEGRPDDATDSDSDDDKVPHVTLSVDSYYDEPNSIIKYDSGAEMLQSLRIETRENSLVGFQNDHCYTPFTSPSQTVPETTENIANYDEPVIEITHTPPPKPVPSSKKITILEQKIIPKGKKVGISSNEALRGQDGNKPQSVVSKSKLSDPVKPVSVSKSDESTESSSISSGDSIPDRDSDSDYKETKDRSGSLKVKKVKSKPRILKSVSGKTKLEQKVISRLKSNKNLIKKEVKERAPVVTKSSLERKDSIEDIESLIPSSEISIGAQTSSEINKNAIKTTPKILKREKKTPSHVTALLSDMTSLFSTPDVIRRVSTDSKMPQKPDSKETLITDKKDMKVQEIPKTIMENVAEKSKSASVLPSKTYSKQKDKTTLQNEKLSKMFDLSTSTIPQLDETSLAQILQDTSGISTNPIKMQPPITAGSMNSPSLTGPLSPTLDLLGGLQPEEEGLTEDLLMHVAQLVESSENLQEVIDKQVLGKVDTTPLKAPTPFQQTPTNSLYAQTLTKSAKTVITRKDPIEIVRRDGRVITLPPIEAPATRASKRKSQMESTSNAEVIPTLVPIPVEPEETIPEPQIPVVSKQYINKKMANKKPEPVIPTQAVDKTSAESQESWNSEDDPYRLWCICKQPHNNRFMICCDGCEDWFHGKCVNITKAMGQQMEEQGIEWRCPNCIKKAKTPSKSGKIAALQKKSETDTVSTSQFESREPSSKTSCIVCKNPARASSIYCSDSCILKHAQDSLSNQNPSNKPENETGKSQDKLKSDSRVIVYERKSGRLLAGPNAPTAENLKSWLQKNPTFEVVRPGALSTIKPNLFKKKTLGDGSGNKTQTTLNFERIPRKSAEQPSTSKSQVEPKSTKLIPHKALDIKTKTPEMKPKTQTDLKSKAQQSEKLVKAVQSPKEEVKLMPQPKTPVANRSQTPQHTPDTPKASTSNARAFNEPRKLIRSTSRTQSTPDKAPSVSPSTSRRKDTLDSSKMKVDSADTIRINVRKALQEQLSQRMAESKTAKFTEAEIKHFANDTELELHELFRDVGMKYKAKYRSLMFNIKDRKNLSLWQKICEKSITPKQLVRLSPEELASQELAEWRDQEAKHQLELIKKSELDLLAASKTYVLKTHKGEEVMETKESVSTELDPNVPVEDLVTALNDSTAVEESKDESLEDLNASKSETPEIRSRETRKRSREEGHSEYQKKNRRDSRRDSDSKKSKSSRRKSIKEKESKEERRSTRRSEKRSTRASSESQKISEQSQYRSRSRKSRKRTKSREHSRSTSQGRERSSSRGRSRKRSPSEDKRKRSRAVSKQSDDKQKHRSRSQDISHTKSKNDSTDSDSVERPKSAMLKEVHPEYDPHEPMITSAFSEEDLRKSRDDVYEDSYKNDVGDYRNADYVVPIDTSIILPTEKYMEKQDKISEPESDQEPSSTVDNSSAIVWNGCINMVDVARFYVAAHEVSGSASDLEEDLSAELDIVGRINPDTVWEYIVKMKRASNKDIVLLKLQAANDEEKMQYIALYSYLSSRNRLGVVKVSNTTSVKDFYIVPLPANTTLPPMLLPLDGPGLGEVKTHLLIAIVIRQRKKRIAPSVHQDSIPAKVVRESRKRSYTPPLANKTTLTPPTSPRRRALPLPAAYTSPALSTSVKDKIAATLASADDDEAYSPGSSSSGGSIATSQPASNTLRNKMEELNRQIEEQKQQILKMTRVETPAGGDDEAYSPSRPMTPPPPVNPLADIALPSNLQEILATIKQRSEPAPADVDMRCLPP